MYRHGDVQLIPIKEIPKEAKKVEGRKELAYGEVTGHAHRIDVGEIFETKDGKLYLSVDNLSDLTYVDNFSNLDHEEHQTLKIKKGKYAIKIKRQISADYNWENVRD